MVDGVPRPSPVPPTVLLERVLAAADARDLERVRALCHPDARLVLRMSDGRALTLDEAVDVLRADIRAGEHEPVHHYVDNLDEHAAIALGSVTRNGRVRHLCWLLTFLDGLVYRQALFGSMGEARAAYAELGLDLGMPGADRPV
jgi:hypothetical protein